MKKMTRGHSLSYKDEMCSKRISHKSSPVERFYAFIKGVCKAEHVAVATIPRFSMFIIWPPQRANWRHSVSCKLSKDIRKDDER